MHEWKNVNFRIVGIVTTSAKEILEKALHPMDKLPQVNQLQVLSKIAKEDKILEKIVVEST